MSVRLMVWNIERFSGGTLADRLVLNYIIETVLDASPDILVIIEGQTGSSAGVGSLMTDTKGRAGVFELWHQLGPFKPNATSNKGWALVPPTLINPGISKKAVGDAARSGYSEAIVVYFRTEKLDFRGPFKWTDLGSVALNSPRPAQAYDGDFQNCLPSTVPLNGNILQQNQLAGQASFENNSQQIYFGSNVRTGFLARSPWHTWFVENTGTDKGRLIKVWAVHLDPSSAEGRANMDALTKIPEITNPLVGTEVRVICGDFNLSPNNGKDRGAFLKFTDNIATYDESNPSGRASRSSVPNAPRGVSTDIYELFLDKGGSPTMLRPINPTARSAGASVKGQPPLYSYTTGDILDNILVAPKNTGKNFTVINRVVGTPYAEVDIFRDYPVGMSSSIDWITWSPAWHKWWKPNYDPDAVFRRSENYGHIREASDHMALVIDV